MKKLGLLYVAFTFCFALSATMQAASEDCSLPSFGWLMFVNPITANRVRIRMDLDCEKVIALGKCIEFMNRKELEGYISLLEHYLIPMYDNLPIEQRNKLEDLILRCKKAISGVRFDENCS